MGDNLQRGPLSAMAYAISLLLHRRIHFPQHRLGKILREDEDFVVFRQMVVDPTGDQPGKPGAIFKVRFQFVNLSPAMNKRTSVFPIPFIAGQPGFRSKMWAWGQQTGAMMGFYEWDSVASAQAYWTSFPMKLMKRRAIPESLSYEIIATDDLAIEKVQPGYGKRV